LPSVAARHKFLSDLSVHFPSLLAINTGSPTMISQSRPEQKALSQNL
jgi:hypothetical protein